MADDVPTAEETKALLAVSRKRALAFGLCLGKKPDASVMILHRNKSPEILMRMAKKAGETPKVTCGKIETKGKKIKLDCAADAPPGLAKNLRRYLQTLGLKGMSVTVLDSTGTVLEEELDEEEQAAAEAQAQQEEAPAEEQRDAPEDGVPEPETEAVPEADNTQALELARRARDLKQTAESIGGASAEKLLRAVGLAAQQIRASEYRRAEHMLGKIDDALRKLTASAAPTGNGPDVAAPSGSSSETGDPLDGGVPLPGGTEAPEDDDSDQDRSGTVEGDGGQSTMPETAEEAIAMIRDRFSEFWDRLTAPTEGDVAREEEQNAIAEQQARIGAIYAAGPLDPERMGEIGVEMLRLGNMVQTARQIEQMGQSHPGAATEARQAMAGFDADLGPGTEVTPELIQQIEAEIQAAEALKTTADQHMAAASALPDGPAKEAALDAARMEMMNATVAQDTAQTRLDSANGKRLLTQAITTGPLSPDAPRPFEDQTAAQFVEAFTRDPELAGYAVDFASTSQNPDAIAAGMAMLADNLDSGFGDREGRMPAVPPFDQDQYARNLVRGAGAEGGEFMAEAGDYVQNGGHLAQNPIPGDGRGRSANRRARARTNFIADAAIGSDGTLDTESEAAQAALGHLRFNPDVIDEPTASLNARVMDTYEMLSDDANQARAQGILDDVDEPQGAGRTLVARSNGGAAADMTAGDARQAVVSSLLTPVHQGQVGSCFSTAGVRRMSETDPLESMERYAELAETGVFRPRNGMDPIPAVLSFPADENPLIRSMEYSTATVMAGMEGNARNTVMQNALNEALDGLVGPVGDSGSVISRMGFDNWEVDERVIRATLIRSFSVEYVATSAATPSADGSSNRGLYTLMQVEGPNSPRSIPTEAIFVQAMTERVLFALAEPADSDKGKEIADVIKSEDYLSDLYTGGRPPWALGTGGMPDEADEVLFGGDRERDSVIGGRSWTDNLAGDTEGDRTESLLENLLETFDERSDEDMVPIMNSGIHAFNGLPNHPSLAALQEGDFDENVERLLNQPGRELAQRDLPEETSDDVFGETIDQLIRFERNAALRGILGTIRSAGIAGDGLRAQALNDAIIRVLAPYLDQLALNEANTWQASQIASGRECDDGERDEKAAEIRVEKVRKAENKIGRGLARAMAPPVFTIAHSNWGGAEEDVFIVMAPDPRTGETMLWKQYQPSGQMEPFEERWVDAAWSDVDIDE